MVVTVVGSTLPLWNIFLPNYPLAGLRPLTDGLDGSEEIFSVAMRRGTLALCVRLACAAGHSNGRSGGGSK